MSSFKKIAIFAPARKPPIQSTLTRLLKLLEEQGIETISEEKATPSLTFGQDSQLIIVIGGDGSMLRAAQNAARYQIPMIGINQGRLGFLTDLRATEIETRLLAVLSGEYTIKERFFLESSVGEEANQLALNDVVISSGRAPHMLELEIYIDEEFVCSERADGLILSTPTGSTAYSLSAGGPILHPSMDAILMLPMFSHTLTSRPLVLAGESRIAIKVTPGQKTACKITCDGNPHSMISLGAEIKIQKSKARVKLLHPIDYSYYENLRSKLYWGKKLPDDTTR